ncbi:MAG: hypothetical protein PHG55_03305 [Verrucomicrobiota bacterium]|nr:hypothetical protein [Verrucomicrobiota bacterium]
MRRVLVLMIVLFGYGAATGAEALEDRWVWLFGWGLNSDSDKEQIAPILDTAVAHGLNGVVLSAGLDSLYRRGPDYFERLSWLQDACAQRSLELIPSLFSVGYGGGVLAHNRHLAEGVSVEGALFRVRGGRAEFEPDPAVAWVNGGFEDHQQHRFTGYSFHDEPGVVSFADRETVHSGDAAIRLENFGSNPHGHGRIMQELELKPHRSYRVAVWVKTEGLKPVSGFQMTVLVGERNLAPRSFPIRESADWQRISMVFNSLEFSKVRIYAGMWGGREGRLWLDDWSVEEVGPINVLQRPGTPVRVESADRSVLYVEGEDYAPLVDPAFQPYIPDHPAPGLTILPEGRIRDGAELRVSWYHPVLIHDSQITICMGEPEVYEIWEEEARLLAERMQPKTLFLNMDEVRMGGTCEACKGRDMAQLLGECITRQVEILRRHFPGARICIWSDMLDPNHNARPDYYLVEGDFTGTWKHVPRDMTIAVWGGEPRESSLRFFDEQGFQVLVACYYDANDLDEVKGWLKAAEPYDSVRGFMYTPWTKKYDLLGAFGDLLKPED